MFKQKEGANDSAINSLHLHLFSIVITLLLDKGIITEEDLKGRFNTEAMNDDGTKFAKLLLELAKGTLVVDTDKIDADKK